MAKSMGYVVIKVCDNNRSLDRTEKKLVREYEAHQAPYIFNDLDTNYKDIKTMEDVSVGDMKRISYLLDNHSKPQVMCKVDNLIRELYPMLNFFGPSVLISEDGCNAQAKHMD